MRLPNTWVQHVRAAGIASPRRALTSASGSLCRYVLAATLAVDASQLDGEEIPLPACENRVLMLSPELSLRLVDTSGGGSKTLYETSLVGTSANITVSKTCCLCGVAAWPTSSPPPPLSGFVSLIDGVTGLSLSTITRAGPNSVVSFSPFTCTAALVDEGYEISIYDGCRGQIISQTYPVSWEARVEFSGGCPLAALIDPGYFVSIIRLDEPGPLLYTTVSGSDPSVTFSSLCCLYAITAKNPNTLEIGKLENPSFLLASGPEEYQVTFSDVDCSCEVVAGSPHGVFRGDYAPGWPAHCPGIPAISPAAALVLFVALAFAAAAVMRRRQRACLGGEGSGGPRDSGR
jgi:hypothetical protein